MAVTRDKRSGAARPPVDEWGVYDPQQAGLAAVLQRLKGRPEPRRGEATVRGRGDVLELTRTRRRPT